MSKVVDNLVRKLNGECEHRDSIYFSPKTKSDVTKKKLSGINTYDGLFLACYKNHPEYKICNSCDTIMCEILDYYESCNNNGDDVDNAIESNHWKIFWMC